MGAPSLSAVRISGLSGCYGLVSGCFWVVIVPLRMIVKDGASFFLGSVTTGFDGAADLRTGAGAGADDLRFITSRVSVGVAAKISASTGLRRTRCTSP